MFSSNIQMRRRASSIMCHESEALHTIVQMSSRFLHKLLSGQYILAFLMTEASLLKFLKKNWFKFVIWFQNAAGIGDFNDNSRWTKKASKIQASWLFFQSAYEFIEINYVFRYSSNRGKKLHIPRLCWFSAEPESFRIRTTILEYLNSSTYS